MTSTITVLNIERPEPEEEPSMAKEKASAPAPSPLAKRIVERVKSRAVVCLRVLAAIGVLAGAYTAYMGLQKSDQQRVAQDKYQTYLNLNTLAQQHRTNGEFGQAAVIASDAVLIMVGTIEPAEAEKAGFDTDDFREFVELKDVKTLEAVKTEQDYVAYMDKLTLLESKLQKPFGEAQVETQASAARYGKITLFSQLASFALLVLAEAAGLFRDPKESDSV